MLVVGDSIMNMSRDEVTGALLSDGWDPRIEAEGGSTILQWAERFPLLEFVDEPNLVVIELGTNDCSPKDCPDLDPYIDRIMQNTRSADAVVWLNVREDNPLLEKRDWVNDELEAAASRWPKLFLVDANGEFNGRDDLSTEDGIHLNDQGQEALAEFIREELEPFRPTAGS